MSIELGLEANALLYSDRPRTAAQYAFAPNPASGAGANGIPGTILIPNDRFSGATTGGLPLTLDGNEIFLPGTITPAQFGKNGNLVAFNPGTVYGNFFGGNASGGDSVNEAPLTALQTPLDRKVLTSIASYDFSPHVHLHAQFFYSDNEAREPVNQPNYADYAFGGSSLRRFHGRPRRPRRRSYLPLRRPALVSRWRYLEDRLGLRQHALARIP